MSLGFRTILRIFKGSERDVANKNSGNNDLRIEIHRENLRQASMNFNMYRLMFSFSCFATFTNTLAGLLGAVLFLFGHIPEGTLTTYVSALSGSCFYQVSREAEERAAQAKKHMEKVMRESDISQRK